MAKEGAGAAKGMAAGFFARFFWWVPFGDAPSLSPEELAAAMRSPSPPQLLDVRTRGEWLDGRIAGSSVVPINELRRRLADLNLDPRRPVVAVCLSGHRSVPAVRLLRASGYPEAVQLRGGMFAWRSLGLSEEKGDPS